MSTKVLRGVVLHFRSLANTKMFEELPPDHQVKAAEKALDKYVLLADKTQVPPLADKLVTKWQRRRGRR